MKTTTLFALALTMFLTCTKVFAAVPRELQDLIPAGKSRLTLTGKTEKNESCIVDFANDKYSFSTSLSATDANGNLIGNRIGTFQIGFGYQLQSVSTQNTNIIAVVFHNAEEQYSNNSLVTLKVNKPGDSIRAVQVIIQEKRLFFGYKTVFKETCIIQ